MERFSRRMRLAVDGGLVLMILGLGGLLLTAWIEYLATPGQSLVDAYWRGREPWTSVSIAVVLGGAVLTLLCAVVVAIVSGSWIRKLLAVAALCASSLWWLVAFGVIPLPRYQPIVPVTLAYSLPEVAAMLVLLPALLAAALALAPRGMRPSSRMAPVHRDSAPR